MIYLNFPLYGCTVVVTLKLTVLSTSTGTCTAVSSRTGTVYSTCTVWSYSNLSFPKGVTDVGYLYRTISRAPIPVPTFAVYLLQRTVLVPVQYSGGRRRRKTKQNKSPFIMLLLWRLCHYKDMISLMRSVSSSSLMASSSSS